MLPTTLKKEAAGELNRILKYWITHAIDMQQGGIIGRIDNGNRAYPEAVKGAVLHARVLWTFAASYPVVQDKRLPVLAQALFQYMNDHFWDNRQGGIFWSVDHKGHAAETKKQVYAQAFAIYAFSEYHKLSGDAKAKERAIELYHLVQRYSYDLYAGGYLEAFTENWRPIDDLRLSEKDANEKKTMNTHLHILEAYTNLYGIWPDAGLARHIQALLDVFDRHIIDASTGHMHLFFDEHWQVKGRLVSFGHDIEASWLLLEAAEALHSKALENRFKERALTITEAVLKGLDKDGGLWYEYDQAEKKWIKEKHWWPQAEALVGFVNAWQIGGNEKYLASAVQTWRFIKTYLLDRAGGEWYWGVTEHYTIMDEDKIGLWKCPYHNGRACLELIKRIS